MSNNKRGNLFKKLREEKGLTQQELSKELHYSSKVIFRGFNKVSQLF